MNCENCGAPMKLIRDRDYFVCEYCTSFYFPRESPDGVRVLGEPSGVECPLCQVPLSSASIGGARVLHCRNCKGISANQQSFLLLVRYLLDRAPGPPVGSPRPLNPQELQRRLYCPYCGRLMDTYPYYGPGNIIIDTCGRCAVIWLDYGELAIITSALRRDRAPWP